VRQLIKRILKEETKQDLSPAIKELLERSVVPNYKDTICQIIVVAPWRRIPVNSEEYEIMVRVVGGVGSENWPMTQSVHRERDKIIDDVWQTVYNYLGVTSSVFLRSVKTCKELMGESELTERCWKGYTQKGMKTMFGKRYPNCVKVKKKKVNESDVLSEEKLPATPKELIKSLPKDLKELLFKQWGAKQNPKWHPEGNSLKHIIVVIKRAYNHYPDDPNMIMAALFHDLGKMDTFAINSKTGQPTAYGHEYKSTDYVEQFKDWVSTFDGTDVDEIKYLVKNHMKIKPRTWDSMRDIKKEPISSHSAFNKLKGFTDKLDGGGYVNESKILDYLQQFLSGEVLDNYKKEQGRKEFQKLVDIAYKITSKDNPIEGMVGVLVGNISKEMWGRNFNVDDDLGSRWDFKVILRPLFTNYNPNKELDYSDRVLKFEEEFNRNARGMGFELISPVQHKKVKDYKVTFEWASRLDVKEM
jgi:hypothetical protein